MSDTVLNVLKQSDTGLTLAQLRAKCKERGIDGVPVQTVKLLIQGFARLDKNPAPSRLKATPEAFKQG